MRKRKAGGGDALTHPWVSAGNGKRPRNGFIYEKEQKRRRKAFDGGGGVGGGGGGNGSSVNDCADFGGGGEKSAHLDTKQFSKIFKMKKIRTTK